MYQRQYGDPMFEALKGKILSEYNDFHTLRSGERGRPMPNAAGSPVRSTDRGELAERQPLAGSLLRPGASLSGVLVERAGYPNGNHDPNEFSADGGLLQYWRILWLQKITILLVAALGGLAGTLITSTEPKTYEA